MLHDAHYLVAATNMAKWLGFSCRNMGSVLLVDDQTTGWSERMKWGQCSEMVLWVCYDLVAPWLEWVSSCDVLHVNKE